MDKRQFPFKFGKIQDLDDAAFEATFWLNATDEQKFEFVAQLVATALELQGKDKNELRLQRAVGSLQRQER